MPDGFPRVVGSSAHLPEDEEDSVLLAIDKGLRSLDALDVAHRRSEVVALNVQMNRLNHLDSLGRFPRLQSLTASANALSTLTGIGFARHLRVLDVACNAIVDVAPLASAPLLEWVSAAMNAIRRVVLPAAALPRLVFLDLSANRLRSWDDIREVALGAPALRELVLHSPLDGVDEAAANPIRPDACREALTASMPALHVLSGETVRYDPRDRTATGVGALVTSPTPPPCVLTELHPGQCGAVNHGGASSLFRRRIKRIHRGTMTSHPSTTSEGVGCSGNSFSELPLAAASLTPRAATTATSVATETEIDANAIATAFEAVGRVRLLLHQNRELHSAVAAANRRANAEEERANTARDQATTLRRELHVLEKEFRHKHRSDRNGLTAAEQRVATLETERGELIAGREAAQQEAERHKALFRIQCHEETRRAEAQCAALRRKLEAEAERATEAAAKHEAERVEAVAEAERAAAAAMDHASQVHRETINRYKEAVARLAHQHRAELGATVRVMDLHRDYADYLASFVVNESLRRAQVVFADCVSTAVRSNSMTALRMKAVLSLPPRHRAATQTAPAPVRLTQSTETMPAPTRRCSTQTESPALRSTMGTQTVPLGVPPEVGVLRERLRAVEEELSAADAEARAKIEELRGRAQRAEAACQSLQNVVEPLTARIEALVPAQRAAVARCQELSGLLSESCAQLRESEARRQEEAALGQRRTEQVEAALRAAKAEALRLRDDAERSQSNLKELQQFVNHRVSSASSSHATTL